MPVPRRGTISVTPHKCVGLLIYSVFGIFCIVEKIYFMICFYKNKNIIFASRKQNWKDEENISA